MIKEIGINNRLYPQFYTAVPRRIRKAFRLKKQKIPQYLLFELYMSIFFAILGPIDIIVVICTAGNEKIIGIIIIANICMGLINNIFFLIMFTFFKRHKSN